MKCLETWHYEARPVGYGMIGWRGHRMVLDGGKRPVARITPFPAGPIMSTNFPGISCLATIM